jgi:dipicolinate synthase subunit A
MQVLLGLLLREGREVSALEGFDFGEPAALLLSPAQRGEGLGAALKRLRPGSMVFAPWAQARLPNGLLWRDLGANEEYALENAYLTAEGALKLLIEHSDFSLRGAELLLLGYGRIASCLAALLRPFEPRLFVREKNEERLGLARERGLTPWEGQPVRLIVGTAPSPALSWNEAARFCCHSLFLELASPPGGLIEGSFFGKTLRAPGLPGKISPHSAAEALLRCLRALAPELF